MYQLSIRRVLSCQAALIAVGACALVPLIAIGHAAPRPTVLDDRRIAAHEAPPAAPPMPTPLQPPGGGPAGIPIERNGYMSYQVNVDADGNNIVGDAANEPSLAIDPNYPGRIAIGWRQFDSVESDFRQAGYAFSTDVGRTWTFPGPLTPGVAASDPVLGSDKDGTFYYLSSRLDELRTFNSADNGETWGIGSQVIPGFADKPWMGIDPTDRMGSGNVYVAWSGTDQFSRSVDGGLTWDDPIPCPLDSLFWGTMAVTPDGSLFMVDRVFNIVRSLNAQDPQAMPSFETIAQIQFGGEIEFGGAPNPGGLLGQPWIVCDRSEGPHRGNLYVLASATTLGNDPLNVKFSRSTDGGTSWSTPIRVNDDPPGNGAWQWFGAMSVAPNGRIDACWYDTRNGTSDISEVYYSCSSDAGETWSKNIAISPAFNSLIGWPVQNKIGDYIQVISGNDGANLAYAATFNGEQDVYFVHIGMYDCNENGVDDEVDIAAFASQDCNANLVPDECEPRMSADGDSDADGDVDLRDVAAFTDCFETGSKAAAACACSFDVDRNGEIDLGDYQALIELITGP